MASPDPSELIAALGLPPPSSVEPVKGGWDTAIWRVELDGAPYALRLFRADQAASSRFEATAMRAAATGGVPAPAVKAEGTWNGRPVVLIGWCAGRTIADELGRQPWRAWRLGLLLGATLA